MFRLTRIYFKYFKSRVLHLDTDSFCKHCGRDVHDFMAPDEVWEKVESHTKADVLCYDCFCDVCHEIGLPPNWFLRGFWSTCKCCDEKFIAENENDTVCHWFECQLAAVRARINDNPSMPFSPFGITDEMLWQSAYL